MPTAIMQQPNIVKNGTCPHGAPLGACPICNGMGGGVKKADHTAKPGEMSWNECAAIGAMLRAQKNAKLQKQKDYVNFAQKLEAFDKKIMNMIENTVKLTGIISDKLPKIIAKPINFLINTFAVNSLKLIKNIPLVLNTLVNNIAKKFADISDKISAVLGEIKAALAKKLGEPFNNFKKKIKSIFSIFETQEDKNEEKEFDETKKMFKLKTFIHRLYGKIKKDKDTTK